MITIKVMETGYDIRTLYRQATTPNQRALLGYIVRKGYTEDYVALGALHLLREIEQANKRKILYQLSPETPNADWIIECCELAQQGAFNKFALSPAEVRKCIRLMRL
jgi:hypothetical protein